MFKLFSRKESEAAKTERQDGELSVKVAEVKSMQRYHAKRSVQYVEWSKKNSVTIISTKETRAWSKAQHMAYQSARASGTVRQSIAAARNA